MTLKEKLLLDHPNPVGHIDEDGDPLRCPYAYKYAEKPEWCGDNAFAESAFERCDACWGREFVEEEKRSFFDKLPKGMAENQKKAAEEFGKAFDEVIECLRSKDTPHILDSGSKTEFTTGAVRDSREGKGRCDLLPLDVVCQYYYDIGLDIAFSIFELIGYFEASGNPVHLLEVLKYFCEDRWDKDCNSMFLETSKQYAEGAEKYGENNWKNGMPVKIYIDSAVRHYLKFLRGDEDEPHDRAFCWNIMCAIWTCKHKPELNDYAKHDISDAVKEMMD